MRNKILNISVIVGAMILSILTYSNLSSEIAIHWTNGVATRTTSKMLGVLLIPLIMIFTYGILSLLFKTDPKKDNLSNKIKHITLSSVLILLFSIHVAILTTGLGYEINMDILASLFIGSIVMILSNIMPNAKKNFIFGLRTPWTLSNDKVWAISNRITGRLFFFAGFLIIISVIIIPDYTMIFSILIVILAALFGTIHSYITYKKIVT